MASAHVSLAPLLDDNPVQATCPTCNRRVLSRVTYKAGLLAYLCCGGMFLCGLVFGCCLIPFCVDRLKDARHSCPNCNTAFGVYKRL